LQGKLDDALKEIIAKLTNKYHLGLCTRHQDLPCFHHHVSDLHFNLDCPCLLVWAQVIKSGSATYEKVPILSPMFKASLALKHASKIVMDSDTAFAGATNMLPATQPPSTPIQGQMPTMPMTPFMNFLQYPQVLFSQMYVPLSLFMGYGPGTPPYSSNPFLAAGLSMVSMPTTPLHHSLLSSPPTANCMIAEFCELYDLGDQVEVGLEKLGFHFGDDLSTVTAEEYAEVGFKPLEWRRVLKAYRKLKQDNHY
jgi:hypothetical protein